MIADDPRARAFPAGAAGSAGGDEAAGAVKGGAAAAAEAAGGVAMPFPRGALGGNKQKQTGDSTVCDENKTGVGVAEKHNSCSQDHRSVCQHSSVCTPL
jgi:hypothetical protein